MFIKTFVIQLLTIMPTLCKMRKKFSYEPWVAETVGQGVMSFLVLRPLHRNVIFALDNHINLAR